MAFRYVKHEWSWLFNHLCHVPALMPQLTSISCCECHSDLAVLQEKSVLADMISTHVHGSKKLVVLKTAQFRLESVRTSYFWSLQSNLFKSGMFNIFIPRYLLYVWLYMVSAISSTGYNYKEQWVPIALNNSFSDHADFNRYNVKVCLLFGKRVLCWKVPNLYSRPQFSLLISELPDLVI
jgi:hypothetical protein